LSGSHLALVPQVLQKLRVAGLHHVPLVVGGIIPEADARALEKEGVARVYTPKDFALNNIMSDLVELVAGSVHPHAAE
jgi:(2R)-ethylmalonyl-CoA mutase